MDGCTQGVNVSEQVRQDVINRLSVRGGTEGVIQQFGEGEPLAQLRVQVPGTEDTLYRLAEGAVVSMGRVNDNEIPIPHAALSRRHAHIFYQDGIFMIEDLNSSNGTFVNDVRIIQPFPLAAGDAIRFQSVIVVFSAVTGSQTAGSLIPAATNAPTAKLIVIKGPQEGHTIPLPLNKITIGRATASATWEVALLDPAVSRPHARMERIDDVWHILDLASANGTFVNHTRIAPDQGRALKDGDILQIGTTLLQFRSE